MEILVRRTPRRIRASAGSSSRQAVPMPRRNEDDALTVTDASAAIRSARGSARIFRLALACEQLAQRLGGRYLLVQHALHAVCDRQIQIVLERQAHDRVDGLDTFDDLADLG